MTSNLASAGSALALCACAAAAPDAAPRQQVEWFRSGTYAGVSAGASNADASASELDSDLAELGHVTHSQLDDTDTGWKIYTGYRFEQPFSIEIGYVELGQVSSTISVTTSDLDQFLADVADVHPFMGSGPFVVGQYSPYDDGRVELGLRLGVWFWTADVESEAATTTSVSQIDFSERSIDPLFGLVFLFELTPWLELRLEYEKYYLDGDDVDFVSAGLQGVLLR